MNEIVTLTTVHGRPMPGGLPMDTAPLNERGQRFGPYVMIYCGETGHWWPARFDPGHKWVPDKKKNDGKSVFGPAWLTPSGRAVNPEHALAWMPEPPRPGSK